VGFPAEAFPQVFQLKKVLTREIKQPLVPLAGVGGEPFCIAGIPVVVVNVVVRTGVFGRPDGIGRGIENVVPEKLIFQRPGNIDQV